MITPDGAGEASAQCGYAALRGPDGTPHGAVEANWYAGDGFTGGVVKRRAVEKGIRRRGIENEAPLRIHRVGRHVIHGNAEVLRNRDRFGASSGHGDAHQNWRVLDLLHHVKEWAGWIDDYLIAFDDAVWRRRFADRQRPDSPTGRVEKRLPIGRKSNAAHPTSLDGKTLEDTPCARRSNGNLLVGWGAQQKRHLAAGRRGERQSAFLVGFDKRHAFRAG